MSRSPRRFWPPEPQRRPSMRIDVVPDPERREVPQALRRDAWTLLEMLPEDWETAAVCPFYKESGEFAGLNLILVRGGVIARNVVYAPQMLLSSPELRATWLTAVRAGFDGLERRKRLGAD